MEMEVPISARPLVGLAIRNGEEGPRDERGETELEGGEEEPRDDDNIRQVGEKTEGVFRSKGTGGVAKMVSKLGDHDGERARLLPHVGRTSTQSPMRQTWMFQTFTIATMHTSLPDKDK